MKSTVRLAIATGEGAAAPPRPLSILLAEDNVVVQRVVTAVLRQGGHSVIAVSNGRMALATVQTSPEPFDAVLMDIQMPDMNGIEATRQIRALDGERGRVLIFGFTSVTFPEILAEARRAGMNDIVHKPAAPRDLFAALGKVSAPIAQTPRIPGNCR